MYSPKFLFTLSRSLKQHSLLSMLMKRASHGKLSARLIAAVVNSFPVLSVEWTRVFVKEHFRIPFLYSLESRVNFCFPFETYLFINFAQMWKRFCVELHFKFGISIGNLIFYFFFFLYIYFVQFCVLIFSYPTHTRCVFPLCFLAFHALHSAYA